MSDSITAWFDASESYQKLCEMYCQRPQLSHGSPDPFCQHAKLVQDFHKTMQELRKVKV